MKKYSSECFVVIFFSFYFLNAFQSDINSNRVYVLGHKYVLGPSQTYFSPRLAARAKMSLSRAQNIFMPANINSIVIFSRDYESCSIHGQDEFQICYVQVTKCVTDTEYKQY